jgi:hypothetical protein
MKYLLIGVFIFYTIVLTAQDKTNYAMPEKIGSVTDCYPQLSPDEKKIVFQSNRMGNRDIFIIDANGKNMERLHVLIAGVINKEFRK